MEASFSKEKSRINWLKSGDSNTIFFHISTITKIKFNLIESLKNDLGEWVTDGDNIKVLILDFFKILFSISDNKVLDRSWNGHYVKLPDR